MYILPKEVHVSCGLNLGLQVTNALIVYFWFISCFADEYIYKNITSVFVKCTTYEYTFLLFSFSLLLPHKKRKKNNAIQRIESTQVESINGRKHKELR